MRVLFLLALAASTLVVGCGPKGPTVVPVSGTVKFKDGSLLKGEILVINFSPANYDNPDGMMPATSDISPEDGSFTLKTGTPQREGATTGEYRVTIAGTTKYGFRKDDVVAPQYADFNATPLAATVTKGEDNVFNFEVEPYKGR